MEVKNLLVWVAAIALNFNVAAAPEMFRYQGRLVDGTNLVNDTLPMSFRLYDAHTGGTMLYEDSASVLVVDGLYSTYIGDDTVYGSLTDSLRNLGVYLEITISGQTLSPREQLVSVPYALNTTIYDPPFFKWGGTVVSSNSYHFGTCYTGDSLNSNVDIYSNNDDIRIMNLGDFSFTISDILSSDPSLSVAFKSGVDWIDELPKVIPPNSTKYIQLIFTPTIAKEYSETFTVVSDSGGDSKVLTCTGRGVIMPYVDNGDGTITDTLTGLMWDNGDPVPFTYMDISWSNALNFCENLNTGGFSNWRMPTAAEVSALFRINGDPEEEFLGWRGTPFEGMYTDNYNFWTSDFVSPDEILTYRLDHAAEHITLVASSADNFGAIQPVRDVQ